MNRYLREARTLLTKIVRKGITLSLDDQIRHFLERTTPPSSKGKAPAAQRKKQKALQHKDSTAALRKAVFQRAEGRCEAIYGTEDGAFERCDANATELDHWLGGGGRRRQKQSVETCWALCRDCHRLRTRGSVEFWNEIFRRHCEDYGYPVIEHIVHGALPAAPAAPAEGPPPAFAGVAARKEEG